VNTPLVLAAGAALSALAAVYAFAYMQPAKTVGCLAVAAILLGVFAVVAAL
jgi:hypothetical protein